MSVKFTAMGRYCVGVAPEKPIFIRTGQIVLSPEYPIRTLFNNLDKLPTDKVAPIIVYCAIGHRGAMAMLTLQLLGYSNTKSIGGGFNNWMKNSLPIVAPVSTPAP
jgi:rhodanese-related sulfurtransferase